MNMFDYAYLYAILDVNTILLWDWLDIILNGTCVYSRLFVFSPTCPLDDLVYVSSVGPKQKR